jgi:Flp pilus assembly protein TadD
MLRYNYARLLTDMGNHADALPEYERVARLFPHQRTFRHMYGVALYNARQSGDAAKEFHAALKLDPHFEPSRQALGKLGIK